MTDRILLITAGRGPSECRAAVTKAARAIAEEAKARDVAISLSHDLDEPRPSIVVHLDGAMAMALADRWIGTVAMVDPSARGRGGRKNFFVAIHPLPPVSEPVCIDPADIRFETMRAGGPGGQHQNTTDSAVRATHVPTGLTTLSRDGRSQHRNKAIAIARLEALASGIHEVEKARTDREGWLKRIEVERGKPVRTV